MVSWEESYWVWTRKMKPALYIWAELLKCGNRPCILATLCCLLLKAAAGTVLSSGTCVLTAFKTVLTTSVWA